MPFTRRRLIARAARASGAAVAASAVSLPLPAPAAAAPRARPAEIKVPAWPPIELVDPPLREADYFALADEVVRRLDRTWDADAQVYSGGGRVIGVLYNAALLVIHATAAERGYDGPSRHDDRARAIAARLCESPPYFDGRTLPHPDTMFHTPGWLGDLGTFDSPMDKAIDPKVAEGLTAAWRARDALGLDPALSERIVHCVDAVARGPFFRFPGVRLNQINWNAELYACAAAMTGDPELLVDDYRRHLRRFVAGARHPLHPGWARNLSPSYRFQYQVDSATSRKNVDSAEYANITLHFIVSYEQALRAGMRPLPGADLDLLRAWAARVQFGSWTHAGMLSWDTGLGFKRWMKAKTWAYALQGPLAIAAAPRFQLDRRQGPWAKYVFDRGLEQFAQRCRELAPRHLPSAHLYGVGKEYQGTGSRRLYVARMGATAMRALTLGLGQMDAEPPPPVYSYDADVGRLSVSTPDYAAAILVRRGGVPYGGVELARLSDARGTAVGGVGGIPPAAFGVVVRRPDGRRVLATQRSPQRASMVLARSPKGRVAHVRTHPRHPDAGPFGALETLGHAAGGGAEVTVAHRFAARHLEAAWRLKLHRARRTAEVQFPGWGGAGAHIAAGATDGTLVALPAGTSMPAAGVAYFHLAGPDGGYVVVPVHGLPARARALRVGRSARTPRPGPTLALPLLPGRELRVRIAPALDAAEAARVAARLAGRFAN